MMLVDRLCVFDNCKDGEGIEVLRLPRQSLVGGGDRKPRALCSGGVVDGGEWNAFLVAFLDLQ